MDEWKYVTLLNLFLFRCCKSLHETTNCRYHDMRIGRTTSQVCAWDNKKAKEQEDGEVKHDTPKCALSRFMISSLGKVHDAWVNTLMVSSSIVQPFEIHVPVPKEHDHIRHNTWQHSFASHRRSYSVVGDILLR